MDDKFKNTEVDNIINKERSKLLKQQKKGNPIEVYNSYLNCWISTMDHSFLHKVQRRVKMDDGSYFYTQHHGI